MFILKKSIIDGVERGRNINVTKEQIEKWQAGDLIQRAMPHLSDDDREFLMTGITPEQWEENFGEETVIEDE